jgi:hypothetical protein
MKNGAPQTRMNVCTEDFLLETVVSAHYLVLQLRMLAGARDFPGAAETAVMADSLSRWAQLVAAQLPGDQRESFVRSGAGGGRRA